MLEILQKSNKNTLLKWFHEQIFGKLTEEEKKEVKEIIRNRRKVKLVNFIMNNITGRHDVIFKTMDQLGDFRKLEDEKKLKSRKIVSIIYAMDK